MNNQNEQLDEATRNRLSKLADMPVDMARLKQKMAGTLPVRPAPMQRAHAPRPTGWLRVAAVLALFIGIAGASYFALFGVAPQTAVAQTMTVAQLHQYLIADQQSTYHAATLTQAQQLINQQLAGEQPLPTVEGTYVESCCLVDGDFPLRAAIVLDQPTGPITIIIAQGEGFAHPTQSIDSPASVKLQGHDHAGVPMVMRNVGDLWMCVMGEVDQSTLADIAAAISLTSSP